MTREARTNCLAVMLLVAGLVADAIGLVVPLPPMAQVHLVKMPVLNNAAHCIFPTANLIAEGDRTVITSFELELEQLAEEQARQQQAMNAKVPQPPRSFCLSAHVRQSVSLTLLLPHLPAPES